MIDPAFWQNRNVFITGHTGFKGAWLCLWLHAMGAKITGYALPPPTDPTLFEIIGARSFVHSVTGDVRSFDGLKEAIVKSAPEIVIHMAAQPLVRESYRNPALTYETNVMGTVNLLEAVRFAVCEGIPVRAVINVTSDKCYRNMEWLWGYREVDPLGGYDPYSNSKACSELVTSSYRNSFFNPDNFSSHGVSIASARAGNVIGGGDWADERLIPDCLRALIAGRTIKIRNPHAVRPWQHVLEPLGGYLLLAQKMFEDGSAFSQGWNFGPNDGDAKPVEWIVSRLCAKWGEHASYEIEPGGPGHEALFLKLDCSKAKSVLGWRPRWTLEQAIDRIFDFIRAWQNGQDVRKLGLSQIELYCQS